MQYAVYDCTIANLYKINTQLIDKVLRVYTINMLAIEFLYKLASLLSLSQKKKAWFALFL